MGHLSHCCHRKLCAQHPLCRALYYGSRSVAVQVGQVLTVGGWVRTGRVMAGFAFLEVSDGTSSQPLQASHSLYNPSLLGGQLGKAKRVFSNQ